MLKHIFKMLRTQGLIPQRRIRRTVRRTSAKSLWFRVKQICRSLVIDTSDLQACVTIRSAEADAEFDGVSLHGSATTLNSRARALLQAAFGPVVLQPLEPR